MCTEAEFLDVIGSKLSKLLGVFPPCYSQSPQTDSPPPPEQKWFETGLLCQHFTLKPTKVLEYAQEHQRNNTFMNLASVHIIFAQCTGRAEVPLLCMSMRGGQ